MLSQRDYLDHLELSVRATNVLRRYEINSIEKFMALTKPQVQGFFKGAGARTWREIWEVQLNLRREERRHSLPGRAVEHIRALNEIGAELASSGFFLRFDLKGRLRLARYATKEDFDEET